MGNQFSIEAAFDALQEIGRVFDGFVQSFVNPTVSNQLGLSRAEYLKAVEDGAPLKFNVYLHNVQPSTRIDYVTGVSQSDGSVQDSMIRDCVVNEKTKVFHRRDCPTAKGLKDGERRTFAGMRDELIGAGYVPCKRCNP